MSDLEWLEKEIVKTERKIEFAESRGDVTAVGNLRETLLRLNRIANVMAVWEEVGK